MRARQKKKNMKLHGHILGKGHGPWKSMCSRSARKRLRKALLSGEVGTITGIRVLHHDTGGNLIAVTPQEHLDIHRYNAFRAFPDLSYRRG